MTAGNSPRLPPPDPRRSRKIRLAALLLAGVAGCFLSLPALAQQPPAGLAPAPGGAPGGGLGPMSMRLVFSVLDQYSYKVHPFYQLTGDPGYLPGKAGGSSSIFISARNTTSEENPLIRMFHSIPPFSLEGVSSLDIFFPKGIGLTFDHNVFSQQDIDAGNEGAAVLPLAMDTYMYLPGFKFFAFDPTTPGLNYYVGIAVGRLEGKVLYPGYYDISAVYHAPQAVGFGKTGVGIQRLGLETKGENMAFRYELMFVRARDITLSTPYPTKTNKVMEMSGTIVRIAFFYEFN